MFTQKNFTKDSLKEISAKMSTEIPAEINKGIELDTYLTRYRKPLDIAMMEVIFGSELAKKDKNGNLKLDKKNNPVTSFNKPLAKMDDLATLMMALNDFCVNVEMPYFASVGYNPYAVPTMADDDMSIPPIQAMSISPLPTLEKFSHKKLNEYIFNDVNGIAHRLIMPMDILPLANIAKKARETKNLHAMLLIGGIALVITGVIVTVHIVTSKDKEEDNEMAEAEALDMSAAEAIDMTEAEEIDMSAAEDMPVVEMPE